ncbi:bacteriocin-protection protein [Pseudolysobacter antarcticus]|uniref:Bacteriocin-protection protein n=2 Tax=Pseudolysobacter antarcticus TaxID=2511995 RepID=A0A411HPW5_9GAMM|nr:bacteriocin-protection protein [Pseudolysobacter antarcticus]
MIDRNTLGTIPIQLFVDQKAWRIWLKKNHAKSTGLWLQLAKKNSGKNTVSYAEALEEALCFGWIDGQKQKDDASFFLQKFTPRTTKSIWSKINRNKADVLIESARMQAAGLRQVELAKADGRWDAAYDGSSSAVVPDDLQIALDANAKAQDFFVTLNRQNRYAILFRIHNVKKAETRARKICEFIAMLERHERVHG